MSARQRKLIIDTYRDPKRGLSGVDEIARRTRLDPELVEEVLKTIPDYQKSKGRQTVKRFARVISTHRNQKHQADLIFANKMGFGNDGGYNYMLSYIDVYTRFAVVIPLPDKRGETLAQVLSVIHTSTPYGVPFKPLILETDAGTEFKNKVVKDYLARQGIELRITMNAPHVEAFNRTFERKLALAMRIHRRNDWWLLVPDVTANYNTSRHRGIKGQPALAYKTGVTDSPPMKIHPLKASPLAIGDKVRIRVDYSKLEAGKNRAYFEMWSDEIAVISAVRRLKNNVFLYYLYFPSTRRSTDHGFYSAELQKV